MPQVRCAHRAEKVRQQDRAIAQHEIAVKVSQPAGRAQRHHDHFPIMLVHAGHADQRLCHEQYVLLSRDHGLGLTGRAAGEHHVGRVGALAWPDPRQAGVGEVGIVQQRMGKRGPVHLLLIGDHQSGSGMRGGEIDVARWPLRVEVDRNRPCGHRGHVGGQVSGLPGQIEHDAIARADTARPQHAGQALHTRGKLGKRQPLVLENEEFPIALRLGVQLQVVKNGVHRSPRATLAMEFYPWSTASS